jgi:hypothetical protein
MEALNKGESPKLNLTPSEFLSTTHLWEGLLENENTDLTKLKQVLSIFEFSQRPYFELTEIIEKTLENIEDSSIKIFSLGLLQKHCVAASKKLSERVPNSTLIVLKNLLEENRDPEVLEWVLRTIEQMGSQSLFFKEQIQKKRPKFYELFNEHSRMNKKLIHYLEEQWGIKN